MLTDRSFEDVRNNFETSAESAERLAEAQKNVVSAADELVIAEEQAASAALEQANANRQLANDILIAEANVKQMTSALTEMAVNGEANSTAYKNLATELSTTQDALVLMHNEAKQNNIGELLKSDLDLASESFKALNLDVNEFSTGISTQATQALSAFSTVANLAGDDTTKLARAYSAATEQVGSNAQAQSMLQQQLLASTNGNSQLADEVKRVALEQRNAKSTADAFSSSIKDIAINAAKGLGVDTVAALGKVSVAFERSTESVRRVADGFSALKNEGLNAGDLLFESLNKLADGAANAAEIDEVRKLYIQFGQDGKLSTQQVEAGIDAINGKLAQTPALLDETARAFKELGIISKIEADKQAKDAIANYELVKNSGQASAGQLSKALDSIYSKIKTSGKSSLQTWYDSQAGALSFSGSLIEVERSATRATGAVRENTDARNKQADATNRAASATANATKNESASLAIMQQVTAGIKDKISALNALSGTADTTDESYEKLMKSMGFVDGFKWTSMADYGRDMERVNAAVAKQAESYSAKNTKRHRGSSSNSAVNTGNTAPNKQSNAQSSQSAAQSTYNPSDYTPSGNLSAAEIIASLDARVIKLIETRGVEAFVKQLTDEAKRST